MTQYVEHRVKGKVKNYVTMAVKIFFGILFAIAFAILMGYGIMWLWNWLMPELFGFKLIGFWQAVGLLALARILFGGLGSGHSKGKYRKRKKKECYGGKKDFSKWKFYDQYWEEEGKKAFDAYVERLKENNIEEDDKAL